MPRLIPPPIVVPPRRIAHASWLPPPMSKPSGTYYMKDGHICTIVHEKEYVLLMCHHNGYIRADCLYATFKDVERKNRNPLLKYGLLWGTSLHLPVQCCSLGELPDILADLWGKPKY